MRLVLVHGLCPPVNPLVGGLFRKGGQGVEIQHQMAGHSALGLQMQGGDRTGAGHGGRHGMHGHVGDLPLKRATGQFPTRHALRTGGRIGGRIGVGRIGVGRIGVGRIGGGRFYGNTGTMVGGGVSWAGPAAAAGVP